MLWTILWNPSSVDILVIWSHTNERNLISITNIIRLKWEVCGCIFYISAFLLRSMKLKLYTLQYSYCTSYNIHWRGNHCESFFSIYFCLLSLQLGLWNFLFLSWSHHKDKLFFMETACHFSVLQLTLTTLLKYIGTMLVVLLKQMKRVAYSWKTASFMTAA